VEFLSLAVLAYRSGITPPRMLAIIGFGYTWLGVKQLGVDRG
jgi:hypothetical protein